MQESERRFLVNPLDFEKFKDQCSKTYIGQYYIGSNIDPNIRIRVRGSNAPKYFLTLKGKKKGVSSFEFETEISQTVANDFVEAFPTTFIEKLRYTYVENGLEWEIDVFVNGLIIAEIEAFPYILETLKVPSWCYSEVTNDASYSNQFMAKPL